MIRHWKYLITFLLFIGLVSMGGASVHLFSENNNFNIFDQEISAVADSLDVQTPSDNGELKFPIEEKSSNPYLVNAEKTGINLDDPDNIEYRTEYNPTTNQVTIFRKVGGIDVKLPYTMSLEEYMNSDMRNSMGQYYRDKIQGDAGNSTQGGGSTGWLNKAYKIGGAGFESVFGSNTVSIKSQGNVEINIGVKHTKTSNPTLPRNVQSNTNFDFNQKIQVNVQGSIGEQLTMGINYNTEANFDFENQMKVKYVGKEDDIIKSIEFGNVSLTLPGTLITGSQSLFGLKTELQFGKLNVTTLFSQQKGQTQTLNVQGGAQQTEFEVSALDYDKNRHFFLSLDFRDKYETAQSSLPYPSSNITIQDVEVWVTNKTGNFDQTRNVCAFTDLGESDLTDKIWGTTTPATLPSNESNNLYQQMTTTYKGARSISEVSTVLQDPKLVSNGFRPVRSYEKLENARKLGKNEYTFNALLGFISLNTSLNNDEVLAVAYKYTALGETKTLQVGELSTDGINAPQVLYVKLLKPTNLTPSNNTTWKLMMKNIYSIGAYQVNRDDFQFDVALLSDSTGGYINYFPAGGAGIKGQRLLRIMNLDNLDQQMQNSTEGDGVFDFVEGYTIYPANGRVIFPVLEPFGKHLNKAINNPDVASKFVFQAIYDSSYTVASQYASKNKFRLRGKYKSSGGSDISLNAMDIPQGAVIVTAGGRKLVENADYTVDYTLGRVKIINKGLLESGAPIQISLESRSLFSMQTKTMMGTHLDYKFNPNFNIGATVMHLNEQPLTQKVAYGSEPISNTIWGFNGSYVKESKGLTNFLNKAPWWNLKDASSITIDGEFAQLVPGHNSAVGKEGSSYIDDFEGTKTSIDMRTWSAWSIASTPQGQTTLFPEGSTNNSLDFGKNRARLAWYIIDPLFYLKGSRPAGISNDDISDDRVRQIQNAEIYPNKQTAYGASTNIATLNLAFYPDERGQYNYDTNTKDINETTGKFTNPSDRWGGIQRSIETNDFEAANIEYIEFWVMDPSFNNPKYKGGDLYINLGSVSEDVLKDGRKSFEQGLPVDGSQTSVDNTAWGKVSTNQALVTAFDNSPSSRVLQDVGLDGLNSANEASYFKTFLDTLPSSINTTLIHDPSSDDFHYFKGSDLDASHASILDRYKFYNNQEGNSKPSSSTTESSTGIPDQEDINRDNTLSEVESYYQYKISLNPADLVTGKNFITDERADVADLNIKLPNNGKSHARWLQFKIPVDASTRKAINGIQDLTSVRFMRMFLKGCSDTTILRFGSLDLVRGDWRTYTNDLAEKGSTSNPATSFDVSAINIDENGKREPIHYVLPPGVDQMQDPSNPNLNKLNEQSIVLNVGKLAPGDARAAYKTMSMDIRQYKRLKMYVHAEEANHDPISNGDMVAFIRIGSDFTDNYYEYEVPLEISLPNKYERSDVWPEANWFNINLESLQTAKLERNNIKRAGNWALSKPFRMEDPEYPNSNKTIIIVGSPNISNVRNIMIGVRNRNDNTNKSIEVWMDELRLTDFDEKGGWAANSRVNIKLAELGSISMAGATSTVGFGSIDKSVINRSQQDFYQYDLATSLELGKFTGPESRLSVPFYTSVSQSISTPKYYPIDPDIKLSTVLESVDSKAEKDSIKRLSQDVTTLRSINFTNVRMQPKSEKVEVYDISNLSGTYSYNEELKHNVTTTYSTDKNFRGMLGYNYNARPKAYEPFAKSAALSNQSFRLIKDFNLYPYPNQFSYSWEVSRNYKEEQLRTIGESSQVMPLLIRKDFFLNKFFDLKYSITKNLKFDFRAITNSTIDEPEGQVTNDSISAYGEWGAKIGRSFRHLGELTNYQHTFNLNYTIPINKLPYLDWTSASLRYGGTYNWAVAPIINNPIESSSIGNTIKNSNTIQANGQLNFSTIYSKSNYLKSIWKKYDFNSSPKNAANQPPATSRFNINGLVILKGKPTPINHKLSSTEVVVKVFDKSGRPINGTVNVVSPNQITFTSDVDADGARAMITGTVKDNSNALQIAGDVSMLFLTSVKTLSVTYTENNGTVLPGYMNANSIAKLPTQPGFFILGKQDEDFASYACDQGWLTTNSSFNSPYLMTKSKEFTIKTTIEPFRGLKLDLFADQRSTKSLSEFYSYDSDRKKYNKGTNTKEMGTYSMSYLTFKTFKRANKNIASESGTYDKFLSNRMEISHRLAGNQNLPADSYAVGYGPLSQDVLIPAFLAAYSGKSSSNIMLEAMPKGLSIIPNWRITYDGIGRMPGIRDYVKNLDISNGYKCNYSVGAYVTNMDYAPNTPDLSNNYISKYQIGTVSLTEAFNPLFLINVVWVNNITTRFEYKTGRAIILSMSNNQLIENYNNEWVFGAGYRFDKLGLILNNKKITNDINLRADFSIRDNISVIRKIEEDVSQLTAGMRTTALIITADYVLNTRFNIQAYYKRNVNTPYISLSYPTADAMYGLSFRVSLTQ